MTSDTTMSEEAQREWYDSAHRACEVCDERVAPVDGDGNQTCCGDCNNEHGFMIGGLVVHHRCRDKYTMDVLAVTIEQALKVRLPLGMEPWALERSRNLATALFFEFDVKLKETP